MYFYKDEMNIQKYVYLYTLLTNIYFPVILITLYFSNGIYSVGSFNFYTVLFIVVILEMAKYFICNRHLRKVELRFPKKQENFVVKNFFKSLTSKSKLREIFQTVLTVFIMLTVFSIVSILYGAEIFTKHEETFMFSALLSVLTVLPLCVNLGPASVASVLLGFKPNDSLEYLMHQNFYLTLLGAWLGAFVIPLDWDKPWQQWPIPCSCGAMMGYLTSHIIMIFHLIHVPMKNKIKNLIN